MQINNHSNMQTIDDLAAALFYTVFGIITSSSVGDVINNHYLLQVPMQSDAHDLLISFIKYGIGTIFSITTFVIVFFVKRFLEKKYKSN